jgi:hypothetical protein
MGLGGTRMARMADARRRLRACEKFDQSMVSS